MKQRSLLLNKAPLCGICNEQRTCRTCAARRAAISSIFLASGLYCSQAESTPAHLAVTQADMVQDKKIRTEKE